MSIATGLKAPPRFVTNPWAWSYTLNKLDGKGQLDEGGNPRNYGAAVAIYKRVVAKYEGIAAPSYQPIVRADLLQLDVAQWVVSRGSAWAAGEGFTARVYHDQGRWWVERVELATVAPLKNDVVMWLLRHVDGADNWIATFAV